MAKFVKSFRLFLESEEVEDINISSSEENIDLESDNKENIVDSIKSIESKIKDFNSKKGSIDNAYKTIKDDNQLKIVIQKILGNDIKKRNEFLVQYEKFAQDERNLLKLQKSIVDDTNSISKLNKDIQSMNILLSNEQNKDSLDKLKNSISNTNKAINSYKLNINNNNKVIPKLKQSISRKKIFIDSMKQKLTQLSNMKSH